jgi:hypothetical protein
MLIAPSFPAARSGMTASGTEAPEVEFSTKAEVFGRSLLLVSEGVLFYILFLFLILCLSTLASTA